MNVLDILNKYLESEAKKALEIMNSAPEPICSCGFIMNYMETCPKCHFHTVGIYD